MKKTTKKFFTIIFAVLYAALFAYIIFQSCESAEESLTESNEISSYLVRFEFFAKLSASGELSEVVRKFIGHFCEFGLLGIFGYLLFYFATDKACRQILNVITGAFCCVIAEAIQLFAIERGPSFMDALIDFQGYNTALCAMTFIVYIINVIAKNHSSAIFRNFALCSPIVALSFVPYIFITELSAGKVICYYAFLFAFTVTLLPLFITEIIKKAKKNPR